MTLESLQTFQFGSRVRVTASGREGLGFIENGNTLNLWVVLDGDDDPTEVRCTEVEVISVPNPIDPDVLRVIQSAPFKAGYKAAMLVMTRMIAEEANRVTS
jgi:hypothetical protein